MALYLIGDVQGCNDALGRLLDAIGFSASRDTAYLLGDLVNRGPDSAGVVRRLMGLGTSAQCLLGNHDLSLLAVAHGVRKPHRNDTIGPLLDANDRPALIDWLRHQPLAIHAHGVLMVHAGVLPSWDLRTTLALAREVENVLRGPGIAEFLPLMYGNEPVQWSPGLGGPDRLRVVVNALTRLRFCTADGAMELKAAGPPDEAPKGYMPWFDVPGRRTAGTTVAFGHWSQLGLMQRPDLIALDTGCVWGGCLSALELGTAGSTARVSQVRCAAAQTPGD